MRSTRLRAALTPPDLTCYYPGGGVKYNCSFDATGKYLFGNDGCDQNGSSLDIGTANVFDYTRCVACTIARSRSQLPYHGYQWQSPEHQPARQVGHRFPDGADLLARSTSSRRRRATSSAPISRALDRRPVRELAGLRELTIRSLHLRPDERPAAFHHCERMPRPGYPGSGQRAAARAAGLSIHPSPSCRLRSPLPTLSRFASSSPRTILLCSCRHSRCTHIRSTLRQRAYAARASVAIKSVCVSDVEEHGALGARISSARLMCASAAWTAARSRPLRSR